MRNLIIILALFITSSCGMLKFDINGIKDDHPKNIAPSNRDLWLGRSSSEVITHKAFAVLPLQRREGSKDSYVMVFKNSGGTYSSSNCAAYGNWGGCSALGSEIVCNHVFTVENNIVTDYDRIGACMDEELSMYAPLKPSKSLSHNSNPQDRKPASIELKRLNEIDERSGCCSHHGGISHCSSGTLYCSDGWTSGCGC